MAEENMDQQVEVMKERGLTCAKMRSSEKKEYKDAKYYRSNGWVGLANIKEQMAEKIKNVRKSVCKLK